MFPFFSPSDAHEGPKPSVFRSQTGLLPEHLPSHKTGVITLGSDQSAAPGYCRYRCNKSCHKPSARI